MTKKIGLIVGVGAIGKRHARVMAKRYERLLVVDTDSKARDWAASECDTETSCVATLDELADLIKSRAQDVTAVIANWGPSHFSVFEQLVSFGVKRVFCEKPVATSLKQLAEMRRRCVDHNVALTAGLHLRYRGIADFVNSHSVKHLGGPPTSVVVHGGARCLATSGSHWLDLTISIFGDAPESTFATLHGSNINPRSAGLEYWAGSAAWQFSKQRNLTITYDNTSSVHETVVLYSPTGITEIDSDFRVRMFSRDPKEVAADSRVTRAGAVLRETPAAEFTPDFSEVLSVQLDELEGARPSIYGRDAVIDSATALVAAFESSRLGVRMSLPPSPGVISEGPEWNIS